MPLEVSQVLNATLRCGDVARSVRFYCDLLGLTAGDRSGSTALLHDGRGLGAGISLALEQAAGAAGDAAGGIDVGLNRLGLYVSDVDDVHARLVADGQRSFGAPHVTAFEGAPAVRTVVVQDPDGTLVELVQLGIDQVAFVSIGVTDLERSRRFYQDVVGLRPMFDRPPTRQPGDQLGVPGEIVLTAAYYDDPRGSGAAMVELVQSVDPPPTARRPHALGLQRLGLGTSDLHHARAALAALGVSPTSEVPLQLTDPDGVALELARLG